MIKNLPSKIKQISEIRLYQYIAGVLVLVILVVAVVINNRLGNSILRVEFLDVGQGDAIFITAPNGNQVLIDGGPNDRVLGQLGNSMGFFDRSIDMVIATHPDKDHIAGLASVFRLYDVDYFIGSELQSETKYDNALQDGVSNESGLTRITARAGERFILDKNRGIYIDVLFPSSTTENYEETNQASIITRLVYGTKSFLLTGDAYTENEDYIVDMYGEKIKSTVLKIGHHGSKTSSGEKFLLTVLPEYAIVSAGKTNTYGHPKPEVIERFENIGSHILSTIDHGTISFITDGVVMYIDTER